MRSIMARGVGDVFKALTLDSPRHNIHAINQLDPEIKERVYALLIPDRIFEMFRIDRSAFTNAQDERMVRVVSPRQAGFAIVEVREHPDDRDCIFFLEIADTPFFKVEITFLIINDPRSPRFNTDIDDAGRRTKFGTTRRNKPEEVRAMEAGLAPGQVRKGLHMLKDFMPLVVEFLACMGQDMLVAEPLTYHDAIIFEKHGFNYVRGRKKMDCIHEGFQPGGELLSRLDGSTPFRQPGMEKTVRGRSWAIHDGILGEPWKDIEMYLPLKNPARVCTFPGWVY
ncbi:MAG: hypothetical protein PHP28_07035 [Actinomycetota bacterium]|nr:hypothetical protein [Actinomycetota bacterium]MDD5667173.1 hypothetical protein [Actinomycetota bacterium]